MKDRKYVAISIKHSHSINDLVVWGNRRTKDDEERCFAGYTDFARATGEPELYSLEEFREKYGNGVCKTDVPVIMSPSMLITYKDFDTVLVAESDYKDFFGFK